jgi:hypothetical protein
MQSHRRQRPCVSRRSLPLTAAQRREETGESAGSGRETVGNQGGGGHVIEEEREPRLETGGVVGGGT